MSSPSPVNALQALLTAQNEELKKYIALNTQDTQLLLNQIVAMLATLQASIDNQKKPATRKAEAPAAAADATGATTPAAGVVKVLNKRQLFMSKYKTDEEFRKEYTTPELELAMSQDDTICKAPTPEKKLNNQATYVYNYHNDNAATGMMKKLEAYKASLAK